MDCTKTPFYLVGLDFVGAMALTLAEGLKEGRQPFDWQQIDWTHETYSQYYSALLRHVSAANYSPAVGDSCKHWLAVACNAYIIWWHESRKG